jgi:methionyl-tRNA synthetase
MAEAPQKFYLTTPIYYVNARPHIGHAYSTIAADVIARRHRLLGPPVGEDGFKPTFFLTGTDEHGQKVQRSAAAAGIPPQQFADEVSATFRALWDRMGITYDDYIRTTDERHKRGVQKLWQLLEERGAIYLSTYTGQYSVGEEMFVEGPPGTIGPDGKPTETVTEENYFFRLSDYQLPLLDLIESGELHIQPETARNEVLSFIRGNVAGAQSTTEAKASATLAYSANGTAYVPGALKDLSISRTTFDWGIPVPGNEKHVIYVWLDALANYMTAVGYGSDDPADVAKFEKYWPADLHLVGKEITRFHCVYWPAFLLAANISTPKSVVANGWLLFEESKMSKSRGNVVRTETILDAFGTQVYAKQFPDSTKREQDLFAADVIRYFLLREIPFGQDGSFSFDAMITRYNSDLANGYGNLVSRIVTLINKSFQGVIRPAGKDQSSFRNDIELPLGRSDSFMEGGDFMRALMNIWAAIEVADVYISSNAPWKLAKYENAGDQETLQIVLANAATAIFLITGRLYPFIPQATARVWAQLGFNDIEEAANRGALKNLAWDDFKPKARIGESAILFPSIKPAEKAAFLRIMTDMESNNTPQKPEPPTPSKLIDEKTTHTSAVPNDPTHPGAPPRTSALAEPAPGTTVAGSYAISTERTGTPSHTEAPASGLFANSAAHSATPQIAIDDFVKIDLRVAQIVVAERIPKADKLLRLEVDLGYEKRQILSGIAEWYTPEELIGRRIVVIANLAPRKMRGLESHGMLLAASHGENGKPVLATFGEDIALGSRLR